MNVRDGKRLGLRIRVSAVSKADRFKESICGRVRLPFPRLALPPKDSPSERVLQMDFLSLRRAARQRYRSCPITRRRVALSIKIINALFNYPPCKGGELLTLVDMVRLGPNDGSTLYPSVARLMHETGQSRRAVERHLASMVAKGILQVVRRQTAKPTLYKLCLEKVNFEPSLWARPDPAKMTERQKDTPPIPPKDRANLTKNPAKMADDSVVDSLSIRNSAARGEKEQVNPKVKTSIRSAAGDQALSHISAFLKKLPTRAKP